MSLPAWGAWIEIAVRRLALFNDQSLPAWGAWIEIGVNFITISYLSSLPAWGAWIEIGQPRLDPCAQQVAPRMGSVD